jgi:hypothetical protein
MAKKPPPPGRTKPTRPHPAPAKEATDTPVEEIFVNPLFKVVLIILVAFFVGMVGLATALASDDTPNELQKQLFTFCFNGGELVLGTIAGLIAGKGIDAYAYRKAEHKSFK